jgi:hypothetical protein
MRGEPLHSPACADTAAPITLARAEMEAPDMAPGLPELLHARARYEYSYATLRAELLVLVEEGAYQGNGSLGIFLHDPVTGSRDYTFFHVGCRKPHDSRHCKAK